MGASWLLLHRPEPQGEGGWALGAGSQQAQRAATMPAPEKEEAKRTGWGNPKTAPNPAS